MLIQNDSQKKKKKLLIQNEPYYFLSFLQKKPITLTGNILNRSKITTAYVCQEAIKTRASLYYILSY